MPNDDISHPIPDLTGYITEGQVVLSREYHQKGIFPPIYPLASLSRLMKDAIGEGSTREDHGDVASQLYAAYNKFLQIKELESIIGSDSITLIDKKYLKFGALFEEYFANQGETERSFEDTLNIAWSILSPLGAGELIRIKKEYIKKYFVKKRR